MKRTSALILIGLSAMLVACGGSDSGSTPTTLNASQQEKLQSGLQTLKEDAAQMKGQLAECQSSGNAIECISGVVEDFGTDVSNLGETVTSVAGDVSGECAASLNQIGTALGTLGDDFEQVGTTISAGSIAAAVPKLQSLSAQANQIQQSLAASGASGAKCQPGNG